MHLKTISRIFYLAAGYDGLLGIIFVLAPYSLYRGAGIEPPNHLGYVQFPALLLIIFAWMFWQIGQRPLQNRNLIPYGIGLKIAYCAVVLGHWFASGIPSMWKPFAIFDILWALLFFVAYRTLEKERTVL